MFLDTGKHNKGVEIMSSITCKSGASAIYDFASNLLKIYIYV
jgi:hypothetical protein